MAPHGALHAKPSACLILSEYQGSDNCAACILLPRLFVRMHVQALCYEMRHRLNWESCVAVEVVVLASGEFKRRWNGCDFWCCHLVVGRALRPVVTTVAVRAFEPWTFVSRVTYLNH
ncbi:hypothetical protein AVEN_103366-1 [Araneus ventricosus]|uniref:Uncharacterized protein n=1 Tax=Araneus ventricosus TaxID=182803 RepID=A0A4Y2KS56_ARAVE|nr:hypothetical protein AVEN_103366-1 [Araneus ventricosus]